MAKHVTRNQDGVGLPTQLNSSFLSCYACNDIETNCLRWGLLMLLSLLSRIPLQRYTSAWCMKEKGRKKKQQKEKFRDVTLNNPQRHTMFFLLAALSLDVNITPALCTPIFYTSLFTVKVEKVVLSAPDR